MSNFLAFFATMEQAGHPCNMPLARIYNFGTVCQMPRKECQGGKKCCGKLWHCSVPPAFKPGLMNDPGKARRCLTCSSGTNSEAHYRLLNLKGQFRGGKKKKVLWRFSLEPERVRGQD